MSTKPGTPPPGHTWDGTIEDVAARLGEHACAKALGAISALARCGAPATATAEERLALVAKVLDGLDVAEQRPAGER